MASPVVPFATLLLIALSIGPNAILSASSDYFGVRLGSLRNSTYGVSGQVWLANTTVIQITEFRLDKGQKQNIVFAFSSGEQTETAKSLFRFVKDANGEDALVPMKKQLQSGGENEQRVVVMVPGGTSACDWKHFGVANSKTLKYLSAVPIDKPPPESFCCIRNIEQPKKGIIGEHYSAGTGEILVEDAKTLVIHNITLEADRAPDAWVFAGKGEVRQSSGKKALVVGRDIPTHHCSLRDEYRGDSDLRVRLADGQNIYNIDYLSLFCYQYDVDFGHIPVKIDPERHPIPAFIPPTETAGELNNGVMESNDIDGSC